MFDVKFNWDKLITYTFLAVIIAMSLFMFIIILSSMKKLRKKMDKKNFSKCPDFILEKYKVWFKCFQIWETIHHMLIILPLGTSIAMVYFFNVSNSNEAAIILAFLSSLLPLLSYCINTKALKVGFYKGVVCLEQGIIKHNEGVISTEQLIDILVEAEKFTYNS